MKRLVLNGSPRGARSNSRTIVGWILEGMTEAGAPLPVVLDLSHTGDVASHREAFVSADEVLLVFPLYTDSMPGIVKSFIDSLADVEPSRLAGKRLAVVVQSGFPESVHSEPVVAYLARLSARLGLVQAGSAIRGNSEGLRHMPEGMTRKARTLFSTLGRSLVLTGRFDAEAVHRLGRPRRLGLPTRLLLTLLKPTGLLDMYWNMMLRKHGAYDRRFDRPYASALTA
jgi:multimeric flavodoxin WrbA